MKTDSVSLKAVESLAWKRFRNGNGEWIFKDSAPGLAKMIEVRGVVEMNGWKYELSGGKFIVRRRAVF